MVNFGEEIAWQDITSKQLIQKREGLLQIKITLHFAPSV
jgi:hypothetical protein